MITPCSSWCLPKEKRTGLGYNLDQCSSLSFSLSAGSSKSTGKTRSDEYTAVRRFPAAPSWMDGMPVFGQLLLRSFAKLASDYWHASVSPSACYSMNFDSFAEKLKASAAQAAKAAKNFEGLDSMAAQVLLPRCAHSGRPLCRARSCSLSASFSQQDDYIHREEFNVAGRQKKEASPQQQQQEHHQQSPQQSQQQIKVPNPYIDRDPDDSSTLSTHSSLRRAPITATSSSTNRPANAKDFGRSQSHADIVPLKVDVPDRQLSLPVQSDSSSSYDDNDESDDDDPIMAAIRKQKGEPKKQTRAPAPQQKQPAKQKHHRFMEDLDSRMAMENQEEQLPLVASPAPAPSQQPQQPAVAAWFSNVAAKSLELVGRRPDGVRPNTETPASAAPLARAKRRVVPPADEMEKVAVVSSAAVLGEDEMQELAQLRRQQQHRSFGPASTLCHAARQHPREAFVGFTLLLAAFVYFRSQG